MSVAFLIKRWPRKRMKSYTAHWASLDRTHVNVDDANTTWQWRRNAMAMAIPTYMMTTIYAHYCPTSSTNPTTLQVTYACANLMANYLTYVLPTSNSKQTYIDVAQLRKVCDIPHNATNPPCPDISYHAIYQTYVHWLALPDHLHQNGGGTNTLAHHQNYPQQTNLHDR